MEIGESVVFINNVEGVEVGRHGRVMGLCDDTVMVGCAADGARAYLGRAARTDVATSLEAAPDRAGGNLACQIGHLKCAARGRDR